MNNASKIRNLDSNPSCTSYNYGITGKLQTTKEDCLIILKVEIIILSQQVVLRTKLKWKSYMLDAYNKCSRNVEAVWRDDYDICCVAAPSSYSTYSQSQRSVSSASCGQLNWTKYHEVKQARKINHYDSSKKSLLKNLKNCLIFHPFFSWPNTIIDPLLALGC